MPTNLETQVPTRLADLDLTPRGRVHPSPANWRDHFFYQLLPDRFSDGKGELTAWSQVLFTTEVVVAFNPHGMEPRGAYVTIDRGFHPVGSKLQVLYRGDWDDEQLGNPPQNEYIEVEEKDNRAVVRIDLPACGMVIVA
jgi:hypothetical protein